MRGTDSYTKYENQVVRQYRHKLSHAESVEDVKKFFSYTMQELMDRVFDGQITTHFDDVQLEVSGKTGYVISDNLQKQAAFEQAWSESDLSCIVSRLAESALHRFRHLSTNPEKTNAKFNRH